MATLKGITTLGEVLRRPEDCGYECALYLSFGEAWGLDSKGGVLPVGETDEVPEAAGALGLEYVLGIDAVRQIISNAAQQRPELTDEQRLAAFLFYYDNDAFIDFDEA